MANPGEIAVRNGVQPAAIRIIRVKIDQIFYRSFGERTWRQECELRLRKCPKELIERRERGLSRD